MKTRRPNRVKEFLIRVIKREDQTLIHITALYATLFLAMLYTVYVIILVGQ